MSQRLQILNEDDDDPMLSAINLVDVFLVLVVGLLAAVGVQQQTQVQTSPDDEVTIIKNAGEPDMEVIVRKDGKEVRYLGSGSASKGQGVRAGVAYRLEDGNMVYIPESASSSGRADGRLDVQPKKTRAK